MYQELIQNAEDAGASQVKFLHDRHSYGKEKLHSKELAKFQVSLLPTVPTNVVSNQLINKRIYQLILMFNGF